MKTESVASDGSCGRRVRGPSLSKSALSEIRIGGTGITLGGAAEKVGGGDEESQWWSRCRGGQRCDKLSFMVVATL
jgi:hypothetical protein